MSAPQVHPRRRPLYKSLLPHLSTTTFSSSPCGPSPSSSSDQSPDPTCRRSTPHSMRLRKGATFHSPTTPPSEDSDPILNIHSLLRRSPTCPRSLEDAMAAGEKRMALFLDKFERNLSGLGGDSSISSLFDNDSPIPRGMLQAQIFPADPLNTDSDSIKPEIHSKAARSSDLHHRHSCDSGLGSSVSGSNMSSTIDLCEQVRKPNHSLEAQGAKGASTPSAITKSASSAATVRQVPSFGVNARKHIDRLILVPILREKRLSPFHPLVRGIPKRIENKEISCLRDLEKTLLFLAPVSHIRDLENILDNAHTIRDYLKRFTPSKAVYIGFCEFTIQCLHTTVGHLNERDQRRPSDRPYTNGYFLDLVEQIHQYAAMIGAARERQGSRPRSRSAENKAEYSSDEEVTLEGGLGATGRPAELVRRKKDGNTISLRTGELFEEKTSPIIPMMKRSLSMESCDDNVTRSMARRKKNAPPLDINQKCKDCDKVFKRPCDLTKHEKTHSRPWKCAERSCKYFEIGWPTEKERDRHVNDKHSKSPPLFKCHFAPCTYQSKRHSNCKQHMEKAHGWVYVRSKNNGKSGSRVSGSVSGQPTPQTPHIQTPNSGTMDIPTPQSQAALSPYLPSVSPYDQNLQYTGPSGGYPLDDMMEPHNQDFQLFPDAGTNSNMFDDLNTNNPFTPHLDFSAFQASLAASDPNDYVPSLDMHVPSVTSSANTPGGLGSLGSGLIDETPFDPTHTTPDFDFDFDTLDNEYTVMNMQLLTPARSVEVHGLNSFSRNPSPTCPELKQQTFNNINHNISPAGQGNLMLYSPNSQQQERNLDLDLDLDLDMDMDEGFHDGYNNNINNQMHLDMGKPSTDFTLFESPIDTTSNNSPAVITLNNHNHMDRQANYGHGHSLGGSGGRQQPVDNFPALDSFTHVAGQFGNVVVGNDASSEEWSVNQIDPMHLHRDVDEFIMRGF
ncbi:hypothetical protein ACJ72_05026 [Emergomyces africanus]|uniref:C2H2-type domain-containing protein n=1 Tax=Emergomyces africanus TaxID=1955775 RepID=A0A1B7NV29_9EURO|nr:hypothetical protein ACJ72_05026 [Emergomyces africanus]